MAPYNAMSGYQHNGNLEQLSWEISVAEPEPKPEPPEPYHFDPRRTGTGTVSLL
jgi:hypothetical protein